MTLTTELILTGLNRPVFAVAPVGDLGRLFIVEQRGTIRILDLSARPHVLKPAPFLKLTGLAAGNEQGLLGLAFHPFYSKNGLFFVYCTDAAGAIVLTRYKVSAADPDLADPNSAQIVLEIPHPQFTNHNGGWIAFGPDGFLYIGVGDGGGGNDPRNWAQDKGKLLGKMLRIDVDGDGFPADPKRNYRIPPKNPFVAIAGACPEIWALGLRNPWRCSFDRGTGDLYIGDVGQDLFEEINFQPGSSPGGTNYGWRVKEGNHPTGLDPVGSQSFTDPIYEYTHDEGSAVIGGVVYRGAGIPTLNGVYWFADMLGGIWHLRREAGGVQVSAVQQELFPNGGPSALSSFAEDAAGEIYLLNLIPGQLFRIVPSPSLEARSAGALESLSGSLAPLRGIEKSKMGKARTSSASVVWSKRPARAKTESLADGDPIEAAVDQIGFPEVPGVPVKEEARVLLQVAAEVEHALLVQYLYAMYSLDLDTVPGRNWHTPLKDIAKEEMGHLVTVQNLLMSIGAPPYYERLLPSETPSSARWDPFPFALEPLSIFSLAKYVSAESPLPEQLPPELRARAKIAYDLARLGLTPELQPPGTPPVGVNHVGVLYARLYWIFQEDEAPTPEWELKPGIFPDRHLKPGDFAGQLDFQIDTIGDNPRGVPNEAHSDGGVYTKTVSSLTDARTALAFIASEGEGWNSEARFDSHFKRFLGTFEDFGRQSQMGWEPVLGAPVNGFVGDAASDPAVERNRITHPSSMLWAHLLNSRYQMLVGELWLATLLSKQTSGSKRASLFQNSIGTEMQLALGRLSRRLVQLPRKQEAPGVSALKVAGPPFQPPADGYPRDAVKLSDFLRERIDNSKALITRLKSQENTIALTSADTSLLDKLLQKDDALLTLLNS